MGVVAGIGYVVAPRTVASDSEEDIRQQEWANNDTEDYSVSNPEPTGSFETYEEYRQAMIDQFDIDPGVDFIDMEVSDD